MGKGVLVDLTKCIGCRACQVACKQWNELPVEDTKVQGDTIANPPGLSGKTYTTLAFKEVEHDGQFHWVFAKNQCMHCQYAGCKTACLVGAFDKTEFGAIVYEKNKCIGCRYCQMACPFGVPAYEWWSRTPWIQKCTFCADLQSNGLTPACISTCPTDALLFGERDDMIKEGKQRIAANPDKYVNHIYGEKEVGGTAWMYLSAVPFEEVGFYPMREEPVTHNVDNAMFAVPFGLAVVATAMTGCYFIFKRRRKLAQAKSRSGEGK